MPTAGDDRHDYAERASAHAAIHKDAWGRTLADMKARADELRRDGWDAVTIAAGDTAPESQDVGDTDRFGFTHVISDNDAEEFADAFERGEFPEYRVYHQSVEGRAFLLTEVRDPPSGTAILIAGTYELRHAPGLVAAAKRAGEMYTHVETLDRTYLGSFRHDGWERFFPNAERIREYGG